MNELYSGVTRSTLTCQSCFQSSCKFEPFVDISLSIDFHEAVAAPVPAEYTSSHKHVEAITLDECLQNFTKEEDLSEPMMCESCHKKSAMKKQLEITTVPKMLVLHLKRFDAIKRSKLDAMVQFPLYGLTLGTFSLFTLKFSIANTKYSTQLPAQQKNLCRRRVSLWRQRQTKLSNLPPAVNLPIQLPIPPVAF